MEHLWRPQDLEFILAARDTAPPFSRSLPATTPAQQLDRGAQFEQWIVGGIDSLHARDGIEDDLLLFMGIVWDRTFEDDLAESNQRAILGPVNGRVVHDVISAGHLDQQLKTYRPVRDSLRDFVKKEVWILTFDCRVIQIVVPGIGMIR
jgi:hypothetical protein